jgi:perosamine synthetase
MKIIPSFKPSFDFSEILNAVRCCLLQRNESIVNRFENEFAGYLGVKHAVIMPSARWGLYYILKNMNLSEGDEVILPAFTFFAVPAAIIKLKLKPVFVDIAENNLNIDADKIEKSISARTKVIIATHLSGYVCEMNRIKEIAKRHDIKIIEDCAQSIGSEFENMKAGSFGEAAYFTFGLTKGFTTLGGAMITTNNDLLFEKIRKDVSIIRPLSFSLTLMQIIKALIVKIAVSSFVFPFVYCFLRLFSFYDIDIIEKIFREKEKALHDFPETGTINSFHAALGILQLNKIDARNDFKIKSGKYIYDKISAIKSLKIPLLSNKAKNIFSTCPVLFKNKQTIKKYLLKKGIDTSMGYMDNCAGLTFFKDFKIHCQNAFKAKQEALYLPLYNDINEKELIYIIEVISKINE